MPTIEDRGATRREILRNHLCTMAVTLTETAETG
jgi:hypothetical protein